MPRSQLAAAFLSTAVLIDTPALSSTVLDHSLRPWRLLESADRVKFRPLKLACGGPNEPRCPTPDDQTPGGKRK